MLVHKRKKEINEDLIFGRMIVHKRKKEINEDLIFGRMIVHKERVYERWPYSLVKWLCANQKK